MAGVMLKCQVANPAAKAFYVALGYEVDDISSRAEPECEILSRHFTSGDLELA